MDRLTGYLGPLWGNLVQSLEHLSAMLRCPKSCLGQFRGQLGTSWLHLGAVLGYVKEWNAVKFNPRGLNSSLGHLGARLGYVRHVIEVKG